MLPAASWPELNQICALPTIAGNVVMSNQQTVRIGECKSDEEIFVELARRMNLPVCQESVEDVLDKMLKNGGQKEDFRGLTERGWIHVPQKYRKYEDDRVSRRRRGRSSSTRRASRRWATRRCRTTRSRRRARSARRRSPHEYPLVLTTGGRIPVFFNSEHRQLPLCRKGHPEPLCDIHPETAAKLGIEDGDWVLIETRRGRIKQKANVTDEDRCARDPLRARLVVPGARGARLRHLGVEREPANRQPRAVRSADGHVPAPRAPLSRLEAAT